MRLYLSSYDLGNDPDALLTLTGTARRAAVILNALDNRPDARAHWGKDQTDKLVRLGCEARELDLRDHFGATESLDKILRDTDLVWINGGNTFILRRAMRQSGFDALIKGALARDAIVYAGFSAGTVIAFDSLRGLELVDDPNEVPAGYPMDTVWDGLGLIPFAIAVHFKSGHRESDLVDRTVAFYRANRIPYRTLRDGEALVIDGDSEKVAGSRNGGKET
jgi:dipeptidase E